jgi:cinnamyl-alcohol dehydrogenase
MLQEASKSMDYVLDTVATPHDIEPLLALLKVNGKMVILNMVQKAFSLLPATLVYGTYNRSIDIRISAFMSRK